MTVADNSELELSWMFKNCWIKPLPREEIIKSLKRKKGYLQTVGLLCDNEERQELCDRLAKAGVTRILKGANMSAMMPGEAHDGDYSLRRYSKLLEIEE